MEWTHAYTNSPLSLSLSIYIYIYIYIYTKARIHTDVNYSYMQNQHLTSNNDLLQKHFRRTKLSNDELTQFLEE